MYRINDIYLTTQGEGYRAGEKQVFIRFTGCNMRCRLEPGPLSPGGFDCDTEFESGRAMSAGEILEFIAPFQAETEWIMFTGGEPGLQVDHLLIQMLHDVGWKVAIESNGSVKLPGGLDWIIISPKVAEHCIRQLVANELKYVRNTGQGLPKTVVKADHYLISPVFNGEDVDLASLAWCRELVQGTHWKLSVQQHKLDGNR